MPIYPERLTSVAHADALAHCGLASDAASHALALGALSYWTHEEVALAMLEAAGGRREDVYANLGAIAPEMQARLIAAADPGSERRLDQVESGVLLGVSRSTAFPYERQRRMVTLAVLARLRYLALEQRLSDAPIPP